MAVAIGLLAVTSDGLTQEVATGAVPQDRQLESGQARIGSIVIEVDEIFEHEIRTRIYHLANKLHISTRAATIADQLLFHTGDVFQRRVLDETERLLRSQRYLNAASVEPISYHEDNTVDIKVRVHEVWTLSPGISLGRKGGANSVRIELDDTNFLGLGKHIALDRSSNNDRTAWRLGYEDPNLFSTRWTMALSHAQLSDGNDNLFAVKRPFLTLSDRWSAAAATSDTNTTGARYALGEIADQYELHRKSFEVGGGWSSGLQGNYALRYLGGFRYQSRDFEANDRTTLLPDDRVIAYPWFGLERVEEDYLKVRNLDQIGRTEDLNLGSVAHLELGLASTSFGATDNALVVNALLQSGFELGSEQFGIGSFAINGRYEGGEFRNTVADVAGRFYRRQSPHRVLYGSLRFTRAMHLDADEQVLLGGDNGLRGYPLRYQAGNASALAVIEERFYTNWQPLKLFNVGAAVFVDAGRTWGNDITAGAPLGWLVDAGFGLRLGNARSGLGNVLHIDLAFPLTRDKNTASKIDRMQLLIETRKSF